MLECQKELFSLPDGLHYLNCAYMSPLLRSVEAAGVAGIARKRVPSEIKPVDFFAGPDEVRRLFGALINADPRRVAIMPAASYGLALAARNTKCRAGDNVVITAEQFPSNVYVWRRLGAQQSVEVRVAEAPVSANRGEAWNARVMESIDDRTAVVALPHVHWTDGTRFDLRRIGERARAVGAALVIDATQSVGALPFDVREIQPDAVVCAAYKWLLGPYAIGAAYFGARYDGGEPLEETWIAREGSEDFRSLVLYNDGYQPGAKRYDVGEASNFILVPMLIAALRQITAWQPARIQSYCAQLMQESIDEARELGFEVEHEDWRSAHLFGLRRTGLEPERAAAVFAARNVAVSLRGSAVRVSPHLYNDAEDVAALCAALRVLAWDA